jgi:hypothetical protein
VATDVDAASVDDDVWLDPDDAPDVAPPEPAVLSSHPASAHSAMMPARSLIPQF